MRSMPMKKYVNKAIEKAPRCIITDISKAHLTIRSIWSFEARRSSSFLSHQMKGLPMVREFMGATLRLSAHRLVNEFYLRKPGKPGEPRRLHFVGLLA